MTHPAAITTFLFTDIEGSTRLWEQEPERMRAALARHDAIARAAVERHRGLIVKMTGDGVHAAFHDPLDAIEATLELQRALAEAQAIHGVPLLVRCGMHSGAFERRDNDFFGAAVNRAARLMGAAHGGQLLLSQAVADQLLGRLPAGVALRDLGSTRLRDLTQPEHVYQVVHPDLRADFPALRSLEETPNNLPYPVTSFIGRQRELAEIEELLARHRLVTLIGMGGLGKTRLALQVAGDVLESHPDGVWLVELAPLQDSQRVAQAVASALGVMEEAGRPVMEALVRYVKDRKMLLVLDNCEHLTQACAELAKQLLASGSFLKILASSREPLHVAGETTVALQPLAVPDAHETDPGLLAHIDAVRLFLDRAKAAQPHFSVNAQNASAIATICQRLDGIPLAIELAAARVRGLSAQQIAARLGDRFRLLTGGDKTMLPRQQTLRAMIDWSYELLTDAERALFRELSVFAGGWTLEAAEAACHCEEESVIDLLTHLVEKSLVVLEAEGERYQLLETVRQYAEDRLAESGDAVKVHNRHLDYYAALAERAKNEMIGPQQAEWLARIDLERENLLAAHVWADLAEDGAPAGLRLASAVKHYFINRGLLELGHRVTTETLARAGAQARNAERCRALFAAGQLRSLMGRHADAREALEESLAIAAELDDQRAIASILQPLGYAALGEGDLPKARSHLERALALAQQHGDKRELAAARNALAQLHRVEGDADGAEPLFESVVALSRELGDRESICIGLLNLAMVSIGRGAIDRALEMLREASDIAQEIHSRPVWQSLLEVSAGLATARGDWKRAALFFGAAETQATKIGLRRDPADESFLAPLVERAATAIGSESFTAGVAAGCALTFDQATREARDYLSTTC
jgi:predicted ATPase/class 3 adenylate cyclase